MKKIFWKRTYEVQMKKTVYQRKQHIKKHEEYRVVTKETDIIKFYEEFTELKDQRWKQKNIYMYE